ncbi:MAG: ribosome small subunit-dependent GTPase A [Gemmatimonadetes bacterium]|nr:ribosome small subunit-dependent GTPase A [Gemmatimonadota bacterium]
MYRVRTTDGTIEASLRGRLKRGKRKGEQVVIGDLVTVGAGSGGARVIEAVQPRRTWLARRPSWSRVDRVVAANLDRLLVVVSVGDPPPSRFVIDRMLVMGESGGMACQVILNKVDLPGCRALVAELKRAYGAAGYPVLPTSAETGVGIEAFRAVVEAGSSALAGPSGAGKSSLLNRVEPGLDLRTRPVGRRSRAGRHTTVSSRLIALSGGGQVADTPGFSDVGVGEVEAAALGGCFPEFRPFLGGCHFNDCTHDHEPDCAIVAAVAGGHIQQERYASYQTILEEL